jgi:2-aminoethylphosphonate transport system substrate-binding protein
MPTPHDLEKIMTVQRLLLIAAFGLGFTTAARAQDVVTLYSADGLHDGDNSWYGAEFAAFTKATGIRVQYIEGGSGAVVARLEREKANPQADVLVTLPPFIQKAVTDGVLQPYTPTEASAIPANDKDPKGYFVSLVNNYPTFIYNASDLPQPPANFEALLDPKFKDKIQYSTPGQAGDGTAVMLMVMHAYAKPDDAFAYFKKLQSNNRGPSASTGKLTALVNKGELLVANGDLQMNLDQMQSNPNIRIFFPAGPDGRPATFSLAYTVGLVNGAPHAAAGKKLIDWLLSKQAQESVPDLALGLPARSDVALTGDGYKKIQAVMQGVTIWTPDWAKVSDDLSHDVSRWHDATGS